MTEEVWSEACEEAWLNAHNYANEKNCAGVLSSILTLLVALQHQGTTDKVVLHVYLKLRRYDSPIYLLAKKPASDKEHFYLPVVQNDELYYKKVKNQLFVQLETSALHDVIVKEEWKDSASHNSALCSAGFHLPPTAITHCKILE